jgi:hypothetical protein
MIQYQHSPWQQPVPLPRLTRDKKSSEQDSLHAEADPAVLPPTKQSSPLPLASQDDDYQWLILL